MPKIATREKALFLGGYRQGKTTGAKILMRQRLAAGGRFAWYDTPWEAADLAGPTVVVTRALKDVEAALAARKSVVFQPQGGGNRANLEQFLGVCRKYANFTIVVDELHVFVNAHTTAQDAPNLNYEIRMGHKHGRGFWGISHRISDFPGSARIVHHVFHFATLVSIDVENARDLFGDLADELPRMSSSHKFLYWGPDCGAIVCAPLPAGPGMEKRPEDETPSAQDEGKRTQ